MTKGEDGRPLVEEAQVDDISGDYQWPEFVRAVGGDANAIPAVIDPLAGVAVLEAMSRASRSGRTETVAR